MIYKFFFAVLALGSIYSVAAEHVEMKEKVKVELYYECLCPGCIYFYTKLMPPLVKKLGPWLDVHTYPFGNAMFVDAAHTKVQCQHGEAECYGNKLLACSMKQLKQAEKYVYYDACVIARNTTDKAADECGKTFGVDSNAIKQCAKGPEGDRLLRWHGEQTLKVRPGQQYTPYFLINGVAYDGEDVIKAVCAAFKNPPKPCAASFETCKIEDVSLTQF